MLGAVDPVGAADRRGSVRLSVTVHTFVLALEGPSDSGKSALASELGRALGPDTSVLPCYVDLVDEIELPPSRGRDVDEQLDSLRFFMELDRRRGLGPRGARESLVVADRCWLSLLAHVYAVERTGGPVAYARAQAEVAAASGLLQPDLVLFLSVSDVGRQSRVEEGEERRWFTDRAFNREIATFFAEEAPRLVPERVEVLDAEADLSTVASAAAVAIARRRRDS